MKKKIILILIFLISSCSKDDNISNTEIDYPNNVIIGGEQIINPKITEGASINFEIDENSFEDDYHIDLDNDNETDLVFKLLITTSKWVGSETLAILPKNSDVQIAYSEEYTNFVKNQPDNVTTQIYKENKWAYFPKKNDTINNDSNLKWALDELVAYRDRSSCPVGPGAPFACGHDFGVNFRDGIDMNYIITRKIKLNDTLYSYIDFFKLYQSLK